MRRSVALLTASLVASCTVDRELPDRTERMDVAIRLVGADLPPEDMPLPLQLGEIIELEFDVTAKRADGSTDTDFKGFARVISRPGAVVEIIGDRASGRNVLLDKGVAKNQRVRISGARGDTRIWVEDIGYVPGDPFKKPACSDGVDNDNDGKADFPDDPECAFANDDTETGATHAAGVSPTLHIERPRLADVQGRSARTPFPQEGVVVETARGAQIIVTRITSDGFYATDINETGGHGHMFAFTFNTPGGLRVCDRITALSGTALEFFGFTELGFPSFERAPWRDEKLDGACKVPDPIVIDTPVASDDVLMERIESALVRLENVKIGEHFGPDFAINNAFTATASNCDFDGNGDIDFETPGTKEGSCANACGSDPECVEWTGFISRGNYRVTLQGGGSVQVNTNSVTGIDAPSMRGKTLESVTGTLRNFSGGTLNWTVETRCTDDLVCDDDTQRACREGPNAPKSAQEACVFPRTIDDPNEATQ